MKRAMILALLAIALAAGCRSNPKPGVPPGYDADLTPTNNGELWMGGE